MVNYHDPVTISRDYEAFIHTWNVMDGIFIWEFFTTLSYEWDIIRGNRPYRWTIWVYSIARLSTLLAIILSVLGLDTTARMNCQAWVSFNITFAYGAYVASSLLIVLRVIAIWNKDKIAVIIAIGIWLAEIAFLLNGIVRFRSTWSPGASSCILASTNSTEISSIAVLVADIGLLLMMLIGLFLMRLKRGGAFGLGRILWNQGLIWLLIATVAEVPPVVLMLLNLNVPLNQIFQKPCMVAVTIAATRMYRSLVNFDSPKTSYNTPVGSWRVVSEMRARSHAGPNPLNQMEVSVRTERDQFSTSTISCGSADKAGYKVQKVILGGDEENGPEK